MKRLLLCAALLCTSACAQTTQTVPVSGSVSVVTPPPVTPPPSIAWVYHNGAMRWGGDWSFAAKPNYRDTTGIPLVGAFDIRIKSTQWGGWQPFVNVNCQSTISLCFNTTTYTYIFFSAKATVSDQAFAVGFMSSGDTPDGLVLGGNGNTQLAQYCSGGNSPSVGTWESCKIPLSAFKLTNATILKFWISDQTGLASNTWYLNDVGFQ
jgi:hypothetical protein